MRHDTKVNLWILGVVLGVFVLGFAWQAHWSWAIFKIQFHNFWTTEGTQGIQEVSTKLNGIKESFFG